MARVSNRIKQEKGMIGMMGSSFIKKIYAILLPEKHKEHGEIAYWRNRRTLEGDLARGHYEYFYTTHFALTIDFYSGKRILDIGCGPRGSLEWAHDALECVGLDPLADKYLELGADKHRMRYVKSYAEALPFADNYFDVVCSFNSLDHVAHLDRTIKEISRVTKPGGLFLLLTDVNHQPTTTEPLTFSWDISKRFQNVFDVLDEQYYERVTGGLYASVHAGTEYDFTNPQYRYGVLSVKFQKRP